MTHLAPTLLLMIVRIIVYMVQKNKGNNSGRSLNKNNGQFVSQAKHPAAFFLREPSSYSYNDYLYYYRL